MSEDSTSKIPTPNKDTLSSQELLRQLNQQVDDLIELLRSQREMLRARGVALPTGSQDNLRTLKRGLSGLTNQQMTVNLELRRLRGLMDSTALIISSQGTDEVLNQIMDKVIALTGAERGYIVLKNEETGELDEFRVARGLDREQLVETDTGALVGKKGEFIVSKTIVREVAKTGEPVLTDNASQDTRFEGQKSVVGYALRSILAVPLKVRDDVLGVVYCDNRILAGLFQEHELNLLTAFTNQAAVALENARLFESARDQISQLSEMRDLLENIFNSISSGVITINPSGTILTSNIPSHQVLGVDESSDFTDQQLMDVLPDMGDEFLDALGSVLDNGEQKLIEVMPLLPNGGERHWNVIISALRDGSGGRYGLAVVLDDLTEQRAREKTLKTVESYMPFNVNSDASHDHEINLEGEERIVTSIATDVRGFTTFSENLDPQELMTIINKYLSVSSDAITLYEGVVDKYMGDAVTGLFNTQLNEQEDHAIRAVRAAVSIIYDLYALHEILPEKYPHLYFGIGIHTGPAYLGNVGGADRVEFAAIGEATNVSKILEGCAGPGDIMISPATYEIIKDSYDCEEITPDPAKLKGEDLPVIYKVGKRKKGVNTGSLLLDPELADLLKDLGD